jgi:hypothetical protein
MNPPTSWQFAPSRTTPSGCSIHKSWPTGLRERSWLSTSKSPSERTPIGADPGAKRCRSCPTQHRQRTLPAPQMIQSLNVRGELRLVSPPRASPWHNHPAPLRIASHDARCILHLLHLPRFAPCTMHLTFSSSALLRPVHRAPISTTLSFSPPHPASAPLGGLRTAPRHEHE